MTRQTSIEAFHKIRDEGLIGHRQFQVYQALYDDGPMTSNQIYAKLEADLGIKLSSHGAGSRLSELREMGLVAEIGLALDPYTKMKVTLWDVTENLPVEPAHKPTKDDAITALRLENTDLRERIAALIKDNSDLRLRYGNKYEKQKAAQQRWW